MSNAEPLHLFAGFGLELEYMIVTREQLDVAPIADELLRLVGGGYEAEVELGAAAWSNELALHIVELKTNGPAPSLAGLASLFGGNVVHVNRLLEPLGARLLPTAMHPWMDPHVDLRLWPHEYDIVYRTYDRIFDCRGHGWANLQSTHINLPFANDDEFGRLHAAIRLVLPLIPGLAASSPFVDGRWSGMLDARLEFYRTNSRRVPSVAGFVIPERVFTRQDYETYLLGRIYADLAELDPDGVLRHEWVNSRGAIARFDRMAIEIRTVDIQECARADVAVAAAIIAAVRCLVEEWHASHADQREWDERELAALLQSGIEHADRAVIDNPRLLESFGYPERGRARSIDLWQHVIETALAREPGYAEWREPLELITRRGCLARRLLDAAGPRPNADELRALYTHLADGLDAGALFTGN